MPLDSTNINPPTKLPEIIIGGTHLPPVDPPTPPRRGGRPEEESWLKSGMLYYTTATILSILASSPIFTQIFGVQAIMYGTSHYALDYWGTSEDSPLHRFRTAASKIVSWRSATNKQKAITASLIAAATVATSITMGRLVENGNDGVNLFPLDVILETAQRVGCDFSKVPGSQGYDWFCDKPKPR